MDSHQLTFQRAREHLETYRLEFRDWGNNYGYGFPYEHKVDAGEQVLTFNPVMDFPGDRFTKLIGDCIHNLRTSLDHLAYELAQAYTVPLPDSIANTSEFPIYWDPKRFAKEGVRKIGGVDPRAKTYIEAIQPFHAGNAYRHEALWILHELDRVGKHRALHVVNMLIGQVDLAGENMRIESVTVPDPGTRFERGTEIRFRASRIDPNSPMHMHPNIPTNVVVDEGPFAGEPIGAALHVLIDDIARIAISRLEPFLYWRPEGG